MKSFCLTTLRFYPDRMFIAECCDGTYGMECSESCGMCADRVACDKATGVCPSGCEDGFVGDLCLDYGKNFAVSKSNTHIYMLDSRNRKQ